MKKLYIVVCALMLTLCSGCAAPDQARAKITEMMEDRVVDVFHSTVQFQEYLAASEKENSLEYHDAQQMAESYMPDEKDPGMEENAAYVFFADNRYITVDYFLDADMQEPIQKAYVAVKPGEKIYASNPKCANPFTDQYSFDGFRIVELSAKGPSDYTPLTSSGGCIFAAQEAQVGNSFLIEPLGKYASRSLRLRAYWSDASGIQHSISDGRWLVNEKEFSLEDSAVDSFSEYTVKYKYDKGQYYYVRAVPNPWRANQAAGEVEFNQENPNGGQTHFLVELHPYSSVVISDPNQKVSSVRKNGEPLSFDTKAKEIWLTSLKEKDAIEIITNSAYKLTGSRLLTEPSQSEEGWKYSLQISKDCSGEMRLGVEKCSSKTIAVDVPDANGRIRSAIGKFKDRFTKPQPQDAPLLTFSNGEKEYSYSYRNLQNRVSFPLSEPNRVTIRVHTEVLAEEQLKLIVDDTNSYLFDADSTNKEISLAYSDISRLFVSLQAQD